MGENGLWEKLLLLPLLLDLKALSRGYDIYVCVGLNFLFYLRHFSKLMAYRKFNSLTTDILESVEYWHPKGKPAILSSLS